MTTELIEVLVDDIDAVVVEIDEFDPVVVEIGDQGAPGLSAYQIAVAGGFVGDEAAWLASLSLSTDTFEADLVSIYNLFK